MLFQKINLVLLLCFIFVDDVFAETRDFSHCNEPVSCEIYEPDSNLARIADDFNSSKASRRIFSEMHYIKYDPNLTIGFGHWARRGLDRFFRTMYQNTSVWLDFTNTACSWLLENPKHHADFINDTGINESPIDISTCREGLLALLVGSTNHRKTSKLIKWSDVIRGKEPNVFNDGSEHWFRTAITLGITTNSGKLFQAAHWANTVALSAEKKASKIKQYSLGGIATLASANSSGWGTVKSAYNAISNKETITIKHADIDAGKTGIFLGKEIVYPTSSMPGHLVNDSVELQIQLADWHAVVLWQKYRSYKTEEKRHRAANKLKGGKPKASHTKTLNDLSYTRSRMKKIWDRHFLKTWGPIPQDAATFPTQHSGIAMARGSFEEELKILNKQADYEKN